MSFRSLLLTTLNVFSLSFSFSLFVSGSLSPPSPVLLISSPLFLYCSLSICSHSLSLTYHLLSHNTSLPLSLSSLAKASLLFSSLIPPFSRLSQSFSQPFSIKISPCKISINNLYMPNNDYII